MSTEVPVRLTVRRAYAAPELWYTSGREVKLGCSRCPELDYCGGLATPAPIFDCTSLCCGQPESCSRYVCPNQRRYSNLVNEVGGFELHPYRHAVAPRPPLPIYVPYLSDRGSLVGPLPLEAAAISLYSIVDHKTGLSKFPSRERLLEHYRLSRRTKLIITSSAQDRRVERFWHVLQVKNTARSLLALEPSLITTPNFSMHLRTMRHDNLVSMARIAYCFESFAAAGLPVAPHINGRTPFDFGRWIAFLQRSPGIHTIAYELGTAGRSSVRRRWHAEQLVHVARSVERPLSLLLRAGAPHLAMLRKAFANVFYVDSTPLLKAKKRQAGSIIRGARHWDLNPTVAGEGIDELFIQNVQMLRRFYRPLLVRSSDDRSHPST